MPGSPRISKLSVQVLTQAKARERARIIAKRNLFIHILFLIDMCIIGIGSKGSNEYEVNDVIKDLFVYCSNDDSGTETGFTAIKSSINYYQFLLNDFFYIISSGNGTLQQTNVILGTIRLRQLRVRSDTCHVHKSFSRVRNKCYPYYSPDVESTKMFGRDMKWRYSPPKHSYTERYKFGTYHSGGFQVELDPSSTTLLVDLYGMVKNKWIDHYTSAIFIELFTYNPSLDLFTSIKLVIEYPPTGGAFPTENIFTFKLFTYSDEKQLVDAGCEIAFIFFIAYYAIQTIYELWTKGWTLYYRNPLINIIEILVLLAGILLIYKRYMIYIHYKRLWKIDMKSPLMNDELDLIAQMIQSYSKYFAITLMLVWTRVFKFAHFSNVTSFIAIMFKQCWPDILSFSLVLFFSLSAFTVLGIQWFGHRLHSYVNYRYAMFTLFRILIGDVEPNHLYSIRPLMGAMYFFAYAAVVIFLLQSLFLAIINDAYQSIQAISYLDLEPEYEMTFLDETEKLRRHLRDQVMVKEEISKLQQMLSNELEKEDSDAVGLRLNELLHNQGFTMENIHEFYEKYDVNKDAKIDKSEFQQVLSQITATLENCEQEIKELEEKLINLTKQQRKLKKGSNINLASTTRASDKYANDEVISYEEYLILEEELKELQNEVIDVYKNIESKLNPDRRPVNYQPYKLSS